MLRTHGSCKLNETKGRLDTLPTKLRIARSIWQWQAEVRAHWRKCGCDGGTDRANKAGLNFSQFFIVRIIYRRLGLDVWWYSWQLYEASCHALITPQLSLPNNHDINQVDYKTRSIIQQQVYQTKVLDVSDLKQRLIDVWKEVEQSVIDDAIDQRRRNLNGSVAEGAVDVT